MRHSNKILVTGLIGTIASIIVFKDRFILFASIVGFPLLSASFACLVLSASDPKGLLSSIKIPFATFIATLAYSLYLTHMPTMWLTTKYIYPWLNNTHTLSIALYILNSFLVAALLYYAIERPFLVLRNRINNRYEEYVKNFKVFNILQLFKVDAIL